MFCWSRVPLAVHLVPCFLRRCSLFLSSFWSVFPIPAFPCPVFIVPAFPSASFNCSCVPFFPLTRVPYSCIPLASIYCSCVLLASDPWSCVPLGQISLFFRSICQFFVPVILRTVFSILAVPWPLSLSLCSYVRCSLFPQVFPIPAFPW